MLALEPLADTVAGGEPRQVVPADLDLDAGAGQRCGRSSSAAPTSRARRRRLAFAGTPRRWDTPSGESVAQDRDVVQAPGIFRPEED